ncbi:hypothetical protein scyTo_0006737 [Scyliorhinus torazame]|uniref:Uncharacterized protein n=1 Tax=Scyliorhinus torazame TaxID=75743 RepID=A0A401PJQ0_SCYTO|nr:hypothetical protein [Scyliorhinus torazame]
MEVAITLLKAVISVNKHQAIMDPTGLWLELVGLSTPERMSFRLCVKPQTKVEVYFSISLATTCVVQQKWKSIF